MYKLIFRNSTLAYLVNIPVLIVSDDWNTRVINKCSHQVLNYLVNDAQQNVMYSSVLFIYLLVQLLVGLSRKLVFGKD